MSGHDHTRGPFPSPDSSDPLSMMGVAMVGMALEEVAEQEERERRARLNPWQRAEEDRRNREVAEKAWLVVRVVVVGGALLMCLFMLMAFLGH